MRREADVVRSLVEMADPLVDDYDIVDMLTGVAHRCVSLLGVSAAGVMLASPAGTLGLVASSSETMRLLELFELQAQEGPCLDAFRAGAPVEHENLQAGTGRPPPGAARCPPPGPPGSEPRSPKACLQGSRAPPGPGFPPAPGHPRITSPAGPPPSPRPPSTGPSTRAPGLSRAHRRDN